MTARGKPRTRNDHGVVAIEFVVIMPFLILVIVSIIGLADLYSTQTRALGAARDGARALALQAGESSPDADPNDGDNILVEPEGPACPPLSDPDYQSQSEPHPSVTAKATTPYSFDIPFVGTTISREVTERATMPCG